jgi:hypothetical protein
MHGVCLWMLILTGLMGVVTSCTCPESTPICIATSNLLRCLRPEFMIGAVDITDENYGVCATEAVWLTDPFPPFSHPGMWDLDGTIDWAVGDGDSRSDDCGVNFDQDHLAVHRFSVGTSPRSNSCTRTWCPAGKYSTDNRKLVEWDGATAFCGNLRTCSNCAGCVMPPARPKTVCVCKKHADTASRLPAQRTQRAIFRRGH